MHWIRFCGKTDWALKIKEKNLQGKSRNLGKHIEQERPSWTNAWIIGLPIWANYTKPEIWKSRWKTTRCTDYVWKLYLSVQSFACWVWKRLWSNDKCETVSWNRSPIFQNQANKLLKKVWEAFVMRIDRIILREHHETLNTQKKYDA